MTALSKTKKVSRGGLGYNFSEEHHGQMSSIVTSQPYPFEQIWWTETERMLFYTYMHPWRVETLCVSMSACLHLHSMKKEGGITHFKRQCCYFYCQQLLHSLCIFNDLWIETPLTWKSGKKELQGGHLDRKCFKPYPSNQC